MFSSFDNIFILIIWFTF